MIIRAMIYGGIIGLIVGVILNVYALFTIPNYSFYEAVDETIGSILVFGFLGIVFRKWVFRTFWT